MNLSISLFKRHPPANNFEKGVRMFCNIAQTIFGDFPCSIKINFPFGFKILAISFNARFGFEILQKFHVETTASKELSERGIFSAPTWIYSKGNFTFSILSVASLKSSKEGSRPF